MYYEKITKLIKSLRKLNKDKTIEDYIKLLKSESYELDKTEENQERFCDHCEKLDRHLVEDTVEEKSDCLLLILQIRDVDYEWSKKHLEASTSLLLFLFEYDTKQLSDFELAYIVYKAERTIARLRGGYYDVR